jgi:threonine 3-dehydrogenase
MKAVVKPIGDFGLAVEHVPVPTIADNEVLIRVAAAGICGSDIAIYKWDDPWTRQTVKPGTVIGHEFYGHVVDKGQRVVDIDMGMMVTAEGHLNCGFCYQCGIGQGHLCPSMKLIGFERPGAFAEYVAVPASNVIRLNRTNEEVAPMLDAIGNAVHAVSSVEVASQDIVLTGCGPIGLMVVALLKMMGARLIVASDPSEYRRKLAVRAGADLVIDPLSVDSADLLRSSFVAHNGADVLFEVSGQPAAYAAGFSALRSGGRAVLLGLPKVDINMDFANEIIGKGLTVHGITGRVLYETWSRVKDLVGDNSGKPMLDLSFVISHKLKLDQVVDGMDLMISGKCGKVLLFPG